MRNYNPYILVIWCIVASVSCANNNVEDSDVALKKELKRDEQLFKEADEINEDGRQARIRGASVVKDKEEHDDSKDPKHYTTIYDAFSSHDTNGDGYIDQHEFVQFQQDPEIEKVRKTIPELAESGPLLFEEVDENEDNLITIQEMTTITQPLLAKPK